MKKHALLIPILLSLFSCQGEGKTRTIYTSFYPVYDFTKRIVGDHFDVVNLTPAGTEPHDFELSAKQVASLYDGDALFVNGLGMEHWLSSLPEEISKKAYVLSDGIQTRSENGILDPHIWLSPKKAIEEMKNVLSILNTLDIEHKEDYQKNYEKAEKDFLALHEEIGKKTEAFTQKTIVTAHSAFGYFCEEYGLTQVAVHGIQPEEEPTAKEMEEIIQVVKEYKVTTIFTEEMASEEISKKIAEETGCSLDVLHTLEGLEEEEVGKKDYLSIMRENLSKVEKACL